VCDACAPESSIKAQPPQHQNTWLAERANAAAKTTSKASPRRGSKTKGTHGSATKRPRRKSSRTPAVTLPATGPTAPLVASLRAWRLQESKKKRVPAFRVLTNRALVAIAEARPNSAASLQGVNGVGPKLLQTYGAQLVALCARQQ
jgi:DNA topoisomerase-3